MIPVVYGLEELCQNVEVPLNNCTVVTPVINCTAYNYSIFNESGLVETNNLSVYDGSGTYYFNWSNHDEGSYIVKLCDDRTNSILVKYEEDKMIPAALILLPLLFAFALLYWTSQLSNEHEELKLFLQMLMFPLFWLSLHFGASSIIKFYDWVEVEDIIGTIVWIVGIIFLFIVFYFIVQIIRRVYDAAAQKRDVDGDD